MEREEYHDSQCNTDPNLYTGIDRWMMTETVQKMYFTNIQMRNALIQIEDQLVHSAWMPNIVLGINRGGLIPGVYLSHRLGRPHEVLDIRLRDHTCRPDLSALERLEQRQSKILIIDDINDTGATFKYIQDHFGKPQSIRFAAVIHNLPSPIKMDYHGYEINKEANPQWVVFPWEDWDK